MNGIRLLVAAMLASATGAPIGSMAQDKIPVHPTASAAIKLPVEGEFPSLAGATGWLNSPPLSASGLRGKVVLIDVWTYTCVNWLRTLPYVRAWAEKYKNEGLVVIGVHSPEFAFEHHVDNVRQQAKAMRVDYPIAIDNDFAIWRALSNNYWPALYVVDAQGRIRYHQFGEGEYDKSERVIQQLLAEAGASGIGRELSSVDARGAEVPADWNSLKSQENYVGYERTENFSSRGGAVRDSPHEYAVPARLKLNDWALLGDWTMQKGLAVLNKSNGRIVYRFHARDLHLVMGPARAELPYDFACSSTGNRPAPPMVPTSTNKATARRANSDCISSSDSRSRSPIAASRSSSSIRAWRRLRSHSADAECVLANVWGTDLHATRFPTAVARARTARATCSAGA